MHECYNLVSVWFWDCFNYHFFWLEGLFQLTLKHLFERLLLLVDNQVVDVDIVTLKRCIL